MFEPGARRFVQLLPPLALALAWAACGQEVPRGARQLPRYVPREVRPELGDAAWMEIHVHQDGRVHYEGQVLFAPESDDPGVLTRALRELRRAALQAGDATLVPPPMPMSEADEVVLEPVTIRSHKYAEWAHTARLMKICSEPEMAIYAVHLALLAE